MTRNGNISRRQFLKHSTVLTSASIFSLTFPNLIFSQTDSLIESSIFGFNEPYGIALGPKKLIYVTDAAGYCIKVFNRTGKLVNQFGSAGSGGEKLNYPQGIFVDDEIIYVMDSNNGRLAMFDLQGNFLHAIGTIGGYPDAFYSPKGIFVADRIYVCNTRNHFISVFEKETLRLLDKYGDLGDDPHDLSSGSIEYKFRLPTDLTIAHDGKIYVVDSKHGQIKVLDRRGQFLFKFGEIGSADGQFNLPEGIALDSRSNIYVCDSLNARVQKFTPAGVFLGAMTNGLKKPTTIKIDSHDQLFIVDAEQKQVLVTSWKA